MLAKSKSVSQKVQRFLKKIKLLQHLNRMRSMVCGHGVTMGSVQSVFGAIGTVLVGCIKQGTETVMTAGVGTTIQIDIDV